MSSSVSHPVRDLSLVLSLAIVARVLVLQILPLDWNWDSYHHWQISWLSLRMGFPQWRLWDLNGCEYYWGMFPHVVEAALMGVAGSPGIQPFRFLNTVLGTLNAGLVFLVGRRYASPHVGLWAGLVFAIFPVAAVFDVLALQDTMALTFLLSSLYISRNRTFWSGLLLGLAGQSRTELLLVSAIIVVWVLIAERFSTDRLPMLMGWLFVTGMASYHLYTQTGNLFYNLFWSLYNVFTGAPGGGDKPFLEAMWGWISWKLSIWPTKPTGIIILSAALAFPAYFVYTLFRKPKDYQLVYLLPTAAVSAPIFITYLGADERMLLIMLRIVTPIVALGLPILFAVIFRRWERHFKQFSILLLVITTLGFYPLVASYASFQAETTTTMSIADAAWKLYPGGTLVCDYPMMNYRFISRWGLPEKSLISNHYAPQYYRASEPIDYVKWLANHRVTVWVRYGEDTEAVYSAVQSVSPKLLVEVYENSGIRVYVVDLDELSRILG